MVRNIDERMQFSNALARVPTWKTVFSKSMS